MLSTKQYTSLINSIALLNSKLHIDDILEYAEKTMMKKGVVRAVK